MTYPSQPGYPSPYGQQQPPGRQQNTLWLIGGTVVIVLAIVFTVILVAVQGNKDDNSADGGNETTDGGNDGGGDNGGDDGGDDSGSQSGVEMNADACGAFSLDSFTESYGAVDEGSTYSSASSSGGVSSLTCTFYNEDFTSVTIYVSDYDNAGDVTDRVTSDADYYNEANGYTYSEWSDYGDAGSLYSYDYGDSVSSTLHVALGSLDVSISSTLYDNESVTTDAALATMADFVQQCDSLFSDYT
ncbi:hypothetical protein [Glycomyces sp. NPDC047010]|uniref:hypothetical protein n=1 Tax=Glycomyces sp. NPDC047010 TaxID=3155023 RepID=UPI0034101919